MDRASTPPYDAPALLRRCPYYGIQNLYIRVHRVRLFAVLKVGAGNIRPATLGEPRAADACRRVVLKLSHHFCRLLKNNNIKVLGWRQTSTTLLGPNCLAAGRKCLYTADRVCESALLLMLNPRGPPPRYVGSFTPLRHRPSTQKSAWYLRSFSRNYSAVLVLVRSLQLTNVQVSRASTRSHGYSDPQNVIRSATFISCCLP